MRKYIEICLTSLDAAAAQILIEFLYKGGYF